MQEIGRKLLQSVGFASPDDASIAAAIEANNAFVQALEAIRDAAQGLTIDRAISSMLEQAERPAGEKSCYPKTAGKRVIKQRPATSLFIAAIQAIDKRGGNRKAFKCA